MNVLSVFNTKYALYVGVAVCVGYLGFKAVKWLVKTKEFQALWDRLFLSKSPCQTLILDVACGLRNKEICFFYTLDGEIEGNRFNQFITNLQSKGLEIRDFEASDKELGASKNCRKIVFVRKHNEDDRDHTPGTNPGKNVLETLDVILEIGKGHFKHEFFVKPEGHQRMQSFMSNLRQMMGPMFDPFALDCTFENIDQAYTKLVAEAAQPST